MDNIEESYDMFNLNFRIEDHVPINGLEMTYFNSEFKGNRALVKVDTVDNMRVLSFTIPATLPLSQFLRKQLYKAEFLTILSGILNQLIYFEENGMPIKKVLMNTKYMYIELSNLSIQLLYMPIDKEFSDCNISEFIQNFITKIRFADMQCVSCVDEILKYLDSRMMFSLKDFYKFIIELEKDLIEKDVEETGDGTTTVLSHMEYTNFVPYLVRTRTNALVSIDKKEFVVGKSAECDFAIMDNRKISRRHCTFKIMNGECYIIDNNSTNHTYVNGRMIQPDFPVMLKNDDYIRLADEEFKYWVR